MSFISDWSASFKIYRAKFNGSWPAKLTVIWLFLVVGSSAVNWQAFCDMGPNEWGDFLAGTFSPLALFWLVAGYMQQAEALRLNTHEIKLQRRALLLQHRELAEQVKATLKVAAHSEQQAEASVALVELSKLEREDKEREQMMKLQPQFKLSVKTNGVAGCAFELRNAGERALDVSVRCVAFNIIEDGSIISDSKAHKIGFAGIRKTWINLDAGVNLLAFFVHCNQIICWTDFRN